MPENEDIEQALANYQEQHATIKTIESGAESGHFIRGDFQVLDESGFPIVGSKLENQYIRLGFGLFKEESEKVFLGVKEGDEVSVTIPSDKDKPLNYQVKINRVEEQILPELDVELAKSVNEQFNTLEDLKSKVKEDLQTSLDKDHRELIRREIINYFIDNSKVDAPESMVSLYLDQIKENLKKREQQFDEEEMKANYKSHAEWNIKWYLIKDQIIEAEALKVSDDEIKNRIDEMITQNKDDEDKIKTFFKASNNKQNLSNEMLNDRLFERLAEYTKVKVEKKSTNELRKKQAA